MPRRQFNDGGELVYGDFSAISSSHEMEIYDRVLYELMKRQQNIVFGDSFAVTYQNGTTVQVKAGNGMQLDNTQVDPEPVTRLLRVASNTNLTVTTPNASQDRIDLVCIKADRATASTQSRNFKNASDGTVSVTSQIVETDWAADLQIVAGTPGGSPVAPSTPSGWLAIATLYVTAVTGVANQSAITDKRSRYKIQSGWVTPLAITSTYTVDLDDELLIVNAASGSFTINLPAASLCLGKTLRVKNITSVANTVTIDANASETIDGQLTQVLDNDYTSVTLVCDGTQWYLL